MEWQGLTVLNQRIEKKKTICKNDLNSVRNSLRWNDVQSAWGQVIQF
jgi:hypothetical protein